MSHTHPIESLERRCLLATFPAGFSASLVGGGITDTTSMAFLPDGALLVAEQGGDLRVIRQGQLLQTPYVDLNVDPNGERGLLGIAVDPNYATNRHIYLYYTTNTAPKHNRVSRFTTNPDNPNRALAGSEVVLMDLDNLSSATNHNGGAMHFGADGMLYIAIGDNANGANAQSLNSRHGKMLRIRSDGTIPEDNPFYNTATGDNRAIWALGLRNPFTFAVDPADGTIYINDVGQSTWEEINPGVAGANYGWPGIEGPRTNQTPPDNYVDPLFAYGHNGDPATTGTAITGGVFYRPPVGGGGAFPASYTGDYFFADLGNDWIRRLDDNTANASGFAADTNSPVDLKVGFDGSLYYLSRGGTAGVYRVRFTDTAQPTIASHTFLYDELTTLQNAHRIRLVFSEYVGDTLTTADLTLENLTTGQTVSASSIALDYTGATHTAILRFPGLGGVLPDGNYRLTFNASGIRDNSNNALVSTPPFEFHVLTGDANNDAKVDSADFNALAAHFNESGQTWSSGDFNRDQVVNALDFNVLASQFGQDLSAPAAPAAALATSPVARSIFADRKVEENPTRDVLDAL